STFCLVDLCIETIQVAKIRHVSLYTGYISADLLYRRSQLCFTAAGNEYIRAFADKRLCRSKTNPASPTSNECDFAFKLVHVFLSSYQSFQIVSTFSDIARLHSIRS